MKANSLLLRLAWLLLLPACTTPFVPVLDDFHNLVVVDGMVTDRPGPYKVKLARSASLDITTYEPYSGAEVFIEEEGGGRFSLSEVTAGVYHTDSADFRGQVGKSYRIDLVLEDGRRYQSPFEVLRSNPGIDTVRPVAEERYYEELGTTIPGYQFYVTSNTSSDQDAYFLWMMEGTYKYTSDYPIDFVWTGFLRAFPEPYSLYTCWKTYQVEEVATANTQALSEARVVDKPLFFLRGDNKFLSYRYHLRTRQLSVSKSTYEFWEGVRQQSATTTSLYNVQPYLIRGNVRNVDDELEAVLGYFTVAGEAQHELYLGIPTEFDVNYGTCGLDYDGYRWIFGEPASEWPIWVTIGPEGRAIAGEGCMDCREIGGATRPPVWWVE